MHHRYLF